MRTFHVYVMASRSKTLYIGVTSDLEERVLAHKSKDFGGFSAKYNCDRLVYSEAIADAENAIRREKQLKGWRRSKKIWLIERMNPRWLDLGAIPGEDLKPIPISRSGPDPSS